MKILLIGNYMYRKSQSMERFAELLRMGLMAAGHEARLVRPQPFLVARWLTNAKIRKWLGYIDRFILFHPSFKKITRWADVVHLCDHSSPIYFSWLGNKSHLVTCHDMLAVRSALGEFQEISTPLTGRLYQQWILSGLRQAQHVVCVSEKTKDDLLRLTGLPQERVSVVANALNYPYQPLADDIARERLERMGYAGWPFFLHVGGNQWYKNRPGVVRIFRELSTIRQFDQHHLILAGERWPTQLRREIEESGLCNRIHEWIDVSNEVLQALYSSAEALIFPSLQEGFGWPIIEAQSCGCPVFTSNRSPMTEVGGQGAVYINPQDEGASAQIIYSALQKREDLRRQGFENSKNYSIETMISGYEQAYYNILEKN